MNNGRAWPCRYHYGSIFPIASIKAVVVVVMMMVVVGAVTIAKTRPDNDPRSVSPIITVMVVMMMVVVLYKELSHSQFWRASGFINSPQLFHCIRNRF
ncbi:MAG TPA: hypothetical protein VIL63_04100 [Terriglobales bacterium]